jgi:chromosome segregation ATPase
MESSLTTPLQVIHTTVMHHPYTDSFQTLQSQYLLSDIHLQLLVLQILQLIQEYQNFMSSTQDISTDEVQNENHFNATIQMLETQVVRPNSVWKGNYYSTNKKTQPGAEKMQGRNFRSLRDTGFIPYKNLMQDEIDPSYKNLDSRKHDIERTQFLESDNNIYLKLEALMEKQKILVNQMQLNMLNLQQHEMKLEKYYERKLGQETQLKNKVNNQRKIINDLKAQIQTCKSISSYRLLELKNKTREINMLKFRLTSESSVQKQLPNCTNTSLSCLSELRNKDAEIQELGSRLENTEAQIITSDLMSNLSKFNNNVSETQPPISLLNSINSLETQLKHCSVSSSVISLKLKNKSKKVEELTSKLKDKNILVQKLNNCSNSLSFQSSKLNTEIRDLQGQIYKLLNKKTQLKNCSNNYSCILNLHNQTSEIQFFISMMNDNDSLKAQLQKCSIDRDEQLLKLTNTFNELQELTLILSDKQRKLESCANYSLLLLSELTNKTRNLDETNSKLQDMETQLKNCSGDTSSILPILKNKTTEITFLVSVLKERDLLKAQLQNCSAEKMQKLSQLTNNTNEITELRARLRNQNILGTNVQNCSNYSSVFNSEEMYKLLVDEQTKLRTCSHNLSTALLNLHNKTNEIQGLTSMLTTQDNLQAQVQKCYHTLYTTIYENTREINNLTTKLRNGQSCKLQLQNCKNISLALQVELENKTTEIQNLRLENKNYKIQFLNCSNSSYPLYRELTTAWMNMSELGVQLEKCLDNSSTLLNELHNKTNTIRGLTLKLQNGDELKDKVNECTAHSSNLSIELVKKTNQIQKLTSELIAQSNNTHNCSNILFPLLKELRTKTIQVKNLTSVLDNNTTIKNLQRELRQADEKLVST